MPRPIGLRVWREMVAKKKIISKQPQKVVTKKVNIKGKTLSMHVEEGGVRK